MTTRRTFLAGLLASAATGAAQPVPAQPVASLFSGRPLSVSRFQHQVFPLGEAFTTEPIAYSAYVQINRRHAKALAASMQEIWDRRTPDILNSAFNAAGRP